MDFSDFLFLLLFHPFGVLRTIHDSLSTIVSPLRGSGRQRGHFPRASPGVIDGLSPSGYAVRSNRNFTPKRTVVIMKCLPPLFPSERGVRGERPSFNPSRLRFLSS